MPIKTDSKLGMSNRFEVIVDDLGSLGSWTKVDGLDAAWDLCEYRMGDAFNERVFFPGNTKYSNVKLGRAACTTPKKVRDWLGATTTEFKPESTMKMTSRTREQQGDLVDAAERDAPQVDIAGMDAGGAKVAIETLEIAHVGFEELKDRLGG